MIDPTQDRKKRFEELQHKFWKEFAEKFNESQEWLFESVKDWWINECSSEYQRGRVDERERILDNISRRLVEPQTQEERQQLIGIDKVISIISNTQ